MNDFLRRLVDKTDPTASLRHTAYAFVIFCSCLWLSYELVRRGMDATWLGTYTVLMGAVTIAKTAKEPPHVA